MHNAITSPDVVKIIIFPILRDQNVTGATFGYGVLFCSLAILHGGRGIYLLAASSFAISSVFTFSKGTWLMVLLGGLACLAALNISDKYAAPSRRTIVILAFAAASVVLCLAFYNYEMLKDLFLFKMDSTINTGTASDRFSFALAGLYAMLDHPFLGLGFRNYHVVSDLYPRLMPEESANAHNAFLQTAAVGGAGAFLVLTWLFVYPFRQLSRIIPLKTWAGKVYLGAAFLIMLIFGCVQLQLIAQPVYWVFIGLVSGWLAISNTHRRRSIVDPLVKTIIH
jgi:O-antigen ligase